MGRKCRRSGGQGGRREKHLFVYFMTFKNDIQVRAAGAAPSPPVMDCCQCSRPAPTRANSKQIRNTVSFVQKRRFFQLFKDTRDMSLSIKAEKTQYKTQKLTVEEGSTAFGTSFVLTVPVVEELDRESS